MCAINIPNVPRRLIHLCNPIGCHTLKQKRKSPLQLNYDVLKYIQRPQNATGQAEMLCAANPANPSVQCPSIYKGSPVLQPLLGDTRYPKTEQRQTCNNTISPLSFAKIQLQKLFRNTCIQVVSKGEPEKNTFQYKTRTEKKLECYSQRQQQTDTIQYQSRNKPKQFVHNFQKILEKPPYGLKIIKTTNQTSAPTYSAQFLRCHMMHLHFTVNGLVTHQTNSFCVRFFLVQSTRKKTPGAKALFFL